MQIKSLLFSEIETRFFPIVKPGRSMPRGAAVYHRDAINDRTDDERWKDSLKQDRKEITGEHRINHDADYGRDQ